MIRSKSKNMPAGFTTRSIAPTPATLNDETRSVEFVISTEVPARVLDWDRCEFVEEVLLQSGIELPGNKQVPLCDSHNRNSIDDILGSLRDFQTVGAETRARAFFSKKARAAEAFEDVKAGIITDVSVGYVVDESTWIPEGQKQTIAGREYVGPIKVSTRWRLHECSLVAVGADPLAKVRSEKETGNASASRAAKKSGGSFEMNKKLYNLLISRGLAAGSTDEQALAFLGAFSIADQQQLRAESERPDNQTSPADIKTAVAEATRKEQERVLEIRTACKAGNCPDIEEEMIRTGKSADDVRKTVIERMAKAVTPITGSRIEMGKTSDEKFRAAAVDAILMRTNSAIIKDPAPGHDQLSRLGFEALARKCLQNIGMNTEFMGKEDILRAALSRALPSHSSSDFSYILANTAHKAALLGWQYAVTTWRHWCRKGFLSDFKAATRVRLGDAPTLLAVPESGEVKAGTMGDTGESITLVTYARNLSITRKALMNDDLGIFDVLFKAFGARASDLVNSLPYAVLAANAALADTGLLFNTTAVTTAGGHANKASSGGAITNTTIAAGKAAMKKQTGPNGTKMNISPSILLTGPDYENDAQLMTSQFLADTSRPAGTPNPQRNLAPVSDANIAGNAWYLIGDPSMFDTVEVAFLDGNESPTVTETESVDILGRTYTCFIDATAKALDFRAMYHNAGA